MMDPANWAPTFQDVVTVICGAWAAGLALGGVSALLASLVRGR